MCFVLVGQVMRIDHLGTRGPDQVYEIFNRRPIGAVLDGAAGIVQQGLRRIFPDDRRFDLFLAPYDLHFLVAVPFVYPVSRRSAAVGHHNAGEPLLILLKTRQDPFDRHDLQVILVRADAHVGGPAQRRLRFHPIGDKHLG